MLIFVFVIIDVELYKWITLLFDYIALTGNVCRRIVEAERSAAFTAEGDVRKISSDSVFEENVVAVRRRFKTRTFIGEERRGIIKYVYPTVGKFSI